MTTDHMELRKSAAERIAMPGNGGGVVMAYLTMVSVSQIALEELLAAYDALVSAGSKPKKASGYSAEFEEAWSEYPARPGNSKAAAYKAWKARLAAGATVLEMIEGVRKYAAYCKAKGTEPEYVKQAATFFGPGEHFSADWTVPVAVGQPGTWPFPASSQGRMPRAQQQAQATADALARLSSVPVFDPNVIDMEP